MMSIIIKFTGTPRDDPSRPDDSPRLTDLTQSVVGSTPDRKCDTARLLSPPPSGFRQKCDIQRYKTMRLTIWRERDLGETHRMTSPTYESILCNIRLLVVTTLGMVRHYAYGEGGSSWRRLNGPRTSHPFSRFSCYSRKRIYLLFYDNRERISVKTPRCFAANEGEKKW